MEDELYIFFMIHRPLSDKAHVIAQAHVMADYQSLGGGVETWGTEVLFFVFLLFVFCKKSRPKLASRGLLFF